MNANANAPCTTGLRCFQDGFAQALRDIDAPVDETVAGLVSQPAFAVYRNTVLKGCVDALAANYPAVQRLVGEEWFRAAAAVYARAHLPRQPTLLNYGAGFARFLAGFDPAAELPYLAGVAQLDRFWTEAHFARDETALDAACVARLDQRLLAQAVLRPHASARWAWFAAMPIRTIWQRNRDSEVDPAAGDIDWQGEGVLVVRPNGAVDAVAVDEACCAFLDACAVGRPLTEAIQAATEVEGSVDLTQMTATLLSSGAFAQLDLPAQAKEERR